MSKLQERGTIAEVRETERPSDKFQFREFAIDIEGSQDWAKPVPFQFEQENCAKLDGLTAGDVVIVSFYLKGREWNSSSKGLQRFSNNRAVDIEKIDNSDNDEIPF